MLRYVTPQEFAALVQAGGVIFPKEPRAIRDYLGKRDREYLILDDPAYGDAHARMIERALRKSEHAHE